MRGEMKGQSESESEKNRERESDVRAKLDMASVLD